MGNLKKPTTNLSSVIINNTNNDNHTYKKKSYVQVTAGLKTSTDKTTTVEDIQKTLQLILAKLNNQEVIVNELNSRMNKIENSIRGARPKNQK
mgnify:FL=1